MWDLPNRHDTGFDVTCGLYYCVSHRYGREAHDRGTMVRRRVVAGLMMVIVLVGALGLMRHTAMGPILYTVTLGQSPTSLALQEGRAFVGQSGSIRVLDSRTGTSLYTVPAGPWPATMTVDRRARRIIVADSTAIDVLAAQRGGAPRTLQVGQNLGAVAVDERGGHIFATRYDPMRSKGSLLVFDMRTGHLLLTRSISSSPLNVVVDTSVNRLVIATSNSAGDEVVQTYDLVSGRLLRAVMTGVAPPGRTPGAIAVDAQTARIFVINSGENTVSMLDVRDGALLRTMAVGQSPEALAIDKHTGRVFVINSATDSYGVPTDQGSVTVLDAHSGTIRGTIPVGWGPKAVAIDEQRGRVVIVNTNIGDDRAPRGNGTLTVLDARNGAVQRTISAGVAPIAAAVDEQTGHALVLNAGGTVRVPGAWGWMQWVRRWLPFSPSFGPQTRTVPPSVSAIDVTR